MSPQLLQDINHFKQNWLDSRLQVKMNSLDCTRNNSDEQEEPKDQQYPGKLYFRLVFSCSFVVKLLY